MLISAEMEQALNEQIGHEFSASLQYTNMATYFDAANLRMLAKFFHKQSDEERAHALKLDWVDFCPLDGWRYYMPVLKSYGLSVNDWGQNGVAGPVRGQAPKRQQRHIRT